MSDLGKGERLRDNPGHTPTEIGSERMHEEVLKVRALRCPCGTRLQAGDDRGAMHDVLREHIRREHPHLEPQTDEGVEAVVSSKSYGVLYVPVGEQDGIEEEGFGPEPY